MGQWGAEQGAAFTGGTTGVGGLGMAHGQLFGEADKAVELRVQRLDACQQVAAQFAGGKLFSGQGAGDLGEGQLLHIHYSITLGTRYRPFSTAGAMAW